MKKIVAFDEEEQYLMDAVENGFTEPATEAEKEMTLKALRSNRNKAISIRINSDDLDSIKRKADQAGMPYQTLINSILHRYVTGDISIKESL